MGVEIRRARPDEVTRSRDLRLEMLRDSPRFFVQTLEEARSWSLERWEARLLSSLAPDSTLVALVDGDVWAGQAAGRIYGSAEAARAYLLAVYLTPRMRGRHLVDALVHEVGAWAASLGCAELHLDVHQSATAARSAYARLGFAPTGVKGPYPGDHSAREIGMVLPLG